MLFRSQCEGFQKCPMTSTDTSGILRIVREHLPLILYDVLICASVVSDLWRSIVLGYYNHLVSLQIQRRKCSMAHVTPCYRVIVGTNYWTEGQTVLKMHKSEKLVSCFTRLVSSRTQFVINDTIEIFSARRKGCSSQLGSVHNLRFILNSNVYAFLLF